eukprot:gene24959-30154_t
MNSTDATLPCAIIRSDDPKLPTVIFLAGFPDNELSALDQSVPAELSKHFNMVCLCLPGYEKGCTKIRPWGHDMDEIILRLHQSISVHAKAGQPVYLMAHDWGAYLALIYVSKYPQTASKLILLDIGVADMGSLSAREVMVIVTYQTWFAISYIISQTISKVLGSIIFYSFFLPIFSIFWPTSGEKSSVPRKEITVEKCYPYYYFWKNMLTGRKDMNVRFPSSCPYGTKKNCMFHTKKFLDKLDRTDGCKHLGIDGGHWFAKSSPEIVIKESLAFLQGSK